MGEKQEKEEEQARSRQEGRRKDEAEEEFEQNSLETIPPFSTASRLMAPQITIRKRLSPLPLNNNKVEERRRGERERQESEERDGERRQEAEARSDVDKVEERQKYFRRLWSLRQARVSARLKKGRNGAHQNVQKKHQQHQQRRYQQRQNGQKKQKYDTGPRRIVQNSLESRSL